MYNKLFSKILDSSIWLAPDPHRLVWITIIAAMDEDGMVAMASIANLAARARVSVDDARAAVAAFEGPDPDSGDPENDGRRIERVPGGWHVLNAHKYREMVTRTVARERTRERVAKWRAKQPCNAHVTVGNVPVTPSDTVTETYTEAEKDQKQKPRSRGSRLPTDWQPTPKDLSQAEQSRPDLDMREVVANFRDYWQAKAGKDATKLDWDATFRVWIRNQKPATTKPGSKVRSAYDALTQTIQEFKHGSGMVSGSGSARGSELPALGFGGPAVNRNVPALDRDMD